MGSQSSSSGCFTNLAAPSAEARYALAAVMFTDAW